jgi:hypothetical protein
MEKKKREKPFQGVQEKTTEFSMKLAEIVQKLIAFQEAVDEASKIAPITPEEEAAMKAVNAQLGKGDRTGALALLDDAFKKGIVPSCRYYQFRTSITSVDYSAFH